MDEIRDRGTTLEKAAEPAVRLGRPPMAAEHARSERVVTFVTPGELATLRRVSQCWGMSLSATVQRLLFRFIETLDHDSTTSPRSTTQV